jgi:hypothetical protein
MQLEPALLTAANNLAWLLATSSDPNVSDAAEAIRIAEASTRPPNHESAAMLDTLSVAYAAGDRYADAIAAATMALEAAERAGDEALANEIRGRLALYRSSSLRVE